MILGYVEYEGKTYPYVDKDTNGYKLARDYRPHFCSYEAVTINGKVYYTTWADGKSCTEVEEPKKEPLNEFEKAVYTICIDLAQTLIKKNRDYGDSYSKLKEEYGDLALIIRQSDKLERLKTLQKQDNLVNESKTDTKKDGAGYYILDLAYEQLKSG